MEEQVKIMRKGLWFEILDLGYLSRKEIKNYWNHAVKDIPKNRLSREYIYYITINKCIYT